MNPSPTRSVQAAVVALIVVGLLILALGGYLTPLTRIALAPLISAQTWLSTRFSAVQTALNAPQDLARLRQRNQELEAEVARLQGEIIDLKQQMAETRVLSALVDFARVHPENRYLASTVIGRDPSPFLQYIIISNGSDNGLRRGMPIVTEQGLVGRISAVTASAARVQLITDSAAVVNVRIEPSRAQGALRGTVTGELLLDMIPQNAELSSGDLVLTSGLGGSYPANLIIGQVNTVRRRDTDLFQRATIQTAVDFAHLELVLVIMNFQAVDIAPLQPTPGVP
jgi:rod shape-determining protein MreC